MSDQPNQPTDADHPAVHRSPVPADQDHEPARVDEEISEQLTVDPERHGEKG